ncbi:MAG TPA: TIR domain-containing protein [Acidisarcina sp.]
MSYSRHDEALVKPLAGLLGVAADDAVFLDVSSLKPGDLWDEKIMGAVKEASVFVLCWCCESEHSTFVAKEISAALAEGKKKLVPVLFCSTPLPPTMADRQWIDLRGQVVHQCPVAHVPKPTHAPEPAPAPKLKKRVQEPSFQTSEREPSAAVDGRPPAPVPGSWADEAELSETQAQSSREYGSAPAFFPAPARFPSPSSAPPMAASGGPRWKPKVMVAGCLVAAAVIFGALQYHRHAAPAPGESTSSSTAPDAQAPPSTGTSSEDQNEGPPGAAAPDTNQANAASSGGVKVHPGALWPLLRSLVFILVRVVIPVGLLIYVIMLIMGKLRTRRSHGGDRQAEEIAAKAKSYFENLKT